jgi:gamma-glutamyltranspeptidase/glutathione hydrolase
MYSSFDDHNDRPLALDLEKRFRPAVVEELRRRGHQIVLGTEWSNPTAPTVVEYDPTTGVIRAGADVRGHRYALAW